MASSIKTGLPRCPASLSPDAKTEWRRVVPILAKHGLLTKLDRVSLECYCESYGRLLECRKVLNEKGITYEAGIRIYERPEMKRSESCMKQILSFCKEFGLTPSSRGRMQLPEVGDDDGFEKEANA